MTGWTATQLSFGSPESCFHSHSYYDIPVLDAAGRQILVHRMDFAGRRPEPDDSVEVGLIDAERPGSWTRIGETSAWSWQQGPMAQWIAGGPLCVWNERRDEGFRARLMDTLTGEARSLPMPVYTVDGEGNFALGVDMARLDLLRPGYGYAGGVPRSEARRPTSDGIWRMDLQGEGDEPHLLLSLDRAVTFLMEHLSTRKRLRHLVTRPHYWFNHVKIAPDGKRFTVKLRWRRPGGPWNGSMGVSLTARTEDGGDLRLLADATSHVIWRDPRHAYFWREGEIALFEDTAPRGTRRGAIAKGRVDANVHIRHLPPGPATEPDLYVLDTPYREEVAVNLYRPASGEMSEIARFSGHRPARGQFRCDLHPCPSRDGRRIVVCSMHDGGRQVWLLSRERSCEVEE